MSQIALYDERKHRCQVLPYQWYDNYNTTSVNILILKDPFTGCYCRKYNEVYEVCYDSKFCRRFPKKFVPTLNTFLLVSTAIKELLVGDFNNLHIISDMQIEMNYKLRWIQPGVFSNMSNLRNLSISFNEKLVHLELGLFDGLERLDQLTLAKNGFMEVKDFSLVLQTKYVPNLSKLYVKEMPITTVGSKDFHDFRENNVRNLALINSQIDYIDPDVLGIFKRVEILDLGQTNLNETVLICLVEKLTELQIPLKRLGLFSMGFRKNTPKELLKVIARSKVKELSLSKNDFQILTNESFPFMPNIETLEMNDAIIDTLSLDTFKGLTNLKYLHLKKNKFYSIPEGCFLKNLALLDLSECYSDDEPYFSLFRGKFINITGLCTLDLSDNNIRKVPVGAFDGLASLKVLKFSNSNILHIEPGAFLPLQELVYLNLAQNAFPARNLLAEMFLGLGKLETLILKQCAITIIPANKTVFMHLTSLKYLDLSKNHMNVLQPDVFKPLVKLVGLNVAQNNLIVWHEKRLFANNPHLQEFIAYENKLAYLTQVMLEDFSGLNRLDLSKNPFTCICQSFVDFKRFVSSRKTHETLKLIQQSPNFCIYPDERINLTIVDYFLTAEEKDNCIFTVSDYFEVFLIMMVTGVLVLLVTFFVYLYRWQIRYWIFLYKLTLARRMRPKSNLTRNSSNYEYDAFVSYSKENGDFVVRLVSTLENQEPFLKLCVYERDFEIGTVISESVLINVARSRKVLLVISDAYVRSQWCRWEAQVAEHHKIFFENDRGEYSDDIVVLVKLEEVSKRNMSPMLRYLMKTKIYLEWNEERQEQFWEKLKYCLAK